MTVPFTLGDIRNKVRRITGRLNASEITDDQIDQYINTYYVFDLSEQLRLESFRVTYQFVTNANQAIYDFPKELYLTDMPPVFIAGYQSYMTQSRENFFRINPQLQLLQQQVATGTGGVGPYTFKLSNLPIMPGWKRNPPGAYFLPGAGTLTYPANALNWSVVISGQDANGKSIVLVDDGGATATGEHSNTGHLYDPNDANVTLAASRGTIDYITGNVTCTFAAAIALNNPINCQYTPYVASRPQSAVFYQDQIMLYPVPDQAYTVNFEAYKYPTAFLQVANPAVPPATTSQEPQLRELWQLLAYGAADKIFADNGDIESLTKFRPLLEEQLKLVQRRTIVQYTAERAPSIYTEQTNFFQYPFGNMFGGF